MRRFGIIGFVAALSLVVASGVAHAIPQLMLSDGTNTITIMDGGSGDGSTMAGVIAFNGAVGNWIVNVTTAVTKPVLGSAVAPHMDVNSIDLSSLSAPQALTIKFTDDFFGPLPPGYNFEAAIGGTAANTMTYDTYGDAGNVAFGMATHLTGQGPFGPGAFSGTALSGGAFAGAFPYSLTQVLVINHVAGVQSTSFDASLQTVPEPGSLLLLGSGLLGFGYLRRRKRGI